MGPRLLLLVAPALAACTDDVTLRLELPAEAAGGTIALIRDQRDERSLIVLPVGAPLPGLTIAEDEPLTLEALVWREPPAALGELRLAPAAGEPAPRPLAAYRADLEVSAWAELPDIDGVAAAVVSQRRSSCDDVVTRQHVLEDPVETAVVGVLAVEPDRVVVVLPELLVVATSTGLEARPVPIPKIRTAARAPDGTVWVTTSTSVWRGSWNGRDLELSKLGEHERRLPLSLAASDDELLELSATGTLRSFAGGTWTVLHELDVPEPLEARGAVVLLPDGSFVAGVATDPVFVRWTRGALRRRRVEARAEGPLSFATLEPLGLVAGTGLGDVVAESLNFAPLPEVSAVVPVGTDIFVLAPLGPHLIVAGELGFIGLWTARRELCTVMTLGAKRQRHWAPLGEGIAIAGIARDGAAVLVTTIDLSPAAE